MKKKVLKENRDRSKQLKEFVEEKDDKLIITQEIERIIELTESQCTGMKKMINKNIITE